MNQYPHAYDAGSGVDRIERTLMARARVMMVDDEPILIELVRVFLEQAGYQDFIGISDPTLALLTLQDHQPDVLLLDLMMPDISGFDILRAIKTDPERRMLPVIVMTSASDAATKLRVLEMGATDFLAKPVDPSELVLRLRNTLAFKAHRDRLSYFDWLTNLPNRRLFMSQLGSALRRRARREKICGVMWIEIGGIKKINETLGQRAGDRVVQEIAQRLQNSASRIDAEPFQSQAGNVNSIARVAGDEFAVLLPGLARVEQAGELARRLINILRRPIIIDDHELHVTVSIGIAASPADGVDAEQLAQCAHAATADARRREARHFSFYSQDLNEHAVRRLTMERDLRKAITSEEFELYYQPKIATESNRIVGAEALIRWHHPTVGLISPGEFIPLAEELGLIADIGAWVLKQACRQSAAWSAEGLPGCAVAVNISTPHFVDGRLLADVQAALHDAGLPACMLTIEITESLMLEDSDENLQLLESIKMLGVRTALDDFGTGFSSLTYLRRMRIDELKIDRSFIAGIPTDPDCTAIVRALIALSRGLGLAIVAEGVEREEQREFLNRHACDSYQGFLSSQPVPATQFTALLRSEFVPDGLAVFDDVGTG